MRLPSFLICAGVLILLVLSAVACDSGLPSTPVGPAPNTTPTAGSTSQAQLQATIEALQTQVAQVLPTTTSASAPSETDTSVSTQAVESTQPPEPTQATQASTLSPQEATQPPGPPPTAAATIGPQGSPVALAGHPRLFVTAQDLPRLRSWAVDSNPIWAQGLVPLATQAKADMDGGRVPQQDGGTRTFEEYGVEKYAELFAFMSLVSPSQADRDDYAKRARTLLMYGLNEAAKGPAAGQPFRDPGFFTSDSDRSRWRGEAWMFTVDWIYPTLTTEDKATIRKVFLMWADQIVQYGYHGPQPVGVLNDPSLVSNVQNERWAANNYFSAEMRNLGLLAMSLDPADDPNGQLSKYLNTAIGANLYMIDYLYHHDTAGGLAAEGFEYGPQATGYVVQFLYVLHVAGQDDPAKWGPQVKLLSDPYWNDALLAYFHTTSPVPVPDQNVGQVYQPAFYGDGQTFAVPDFIELFAPLGLYDMMTGNTARLSALRWIEINMAPGGADGLLQRVSRADDFRNSIFYFMLLDPKAPPPADPRPAQQLTFFAPGLGHIYARTGWGADATWFGYMLGWNNIDHQHADGNDFHFYRKGEFLTKETTGYDNGTSDFHNTLALENDAPDHNDPTDYRHAEWLTGSQWGYTPSGDGKILAHSFGKDYVYALGDATGLYNSTYELTTDITQASRSIVWLEPDYVITYDRATSKTANRFKRYWLQLPVQPSISGDRATVVTPKGQQLFVTSLSPAGAAMSAEELKPPDGGSIADGEPMKFRMKIEATGNPKDVRFLTVLQGADAGAQAGPATAIASTGGTAYAGAAVGGRAVMFPVDLGGSFSGVQFAAPSDITSILVTGLQPGGGYDVTVDKSGGNISVRVSAGSQQKADDGGVLVVSVP